MKGHNEEPLRLQAILQTSAVKGGTAASRGHSSVRRPEAIYLRTIGFLSSKACAIATYYSRRISNYWGACKHLEQCSGADAKSCRQRCRATVLTPSCRKPFHTTSRQNPADRHLQPLCKCSCTHEMYGPQKQLVCCDF